LILICVHHQTGGDGEHAFMGEEPGDRFLAERHKGDGKEPSLAMWWRWIIVDVTGGAEVLCWDSRQDRLLGSLSWSRIYDRASWHIKSASCL
jgi:hypothetical protein